MTRPGVYIGLGSNLGDRKAYLEAALQALDKARIPTLRRSSLYETEPQDVQNQPWFLNQVVEVQTELFPLQLLRLLQKVEQELGRSRIDTAAKRPRTIDLDLLLFRRKQINTQQLVVPHPFLLQRRFVLEPLVEIAPDLRHPVTKGLLRDALRKTGDQRVAVVTATR